MKRPAFQWYPGDFRRDTAVQACSFEARALWREMLDLMHDGEPRGHLTAGGVPIDTPQLARIVGETVPRVKRWLAELETRKVFSRTEVGVIYSRRMVRDEHVSEVRRHAGKLGGNPNLVNQSDSKTEAEPEQTGEQKQTPAVAVCGLRSADAVASPRSTEQRSEDLPGGEPSAAAAAPHAKATAELPAEAQQFLLTFYGGATSERHRDVLEQLLDLTRGLAVVWKGARVTAGSPERFATKCAEVLAGRHRQRDRDKAISVLLKKLSDTTDVTEAAVQQEREERVDVDRISAGETAHALAWLEDQPATQAAIAARIDAEFPPATAGPFAVVVRKAGRDSLAYHAWKAAGAPVLTPAGSGHRSGTSP